MKLKKITGLLAAVIITIAIVKIVQGFVLPSLLFMYIQPQVKSLQDKSRPVDLRISSAATVRMFGGVRAIDILQSILWNKEEPVELRNAAADELKQIKDIRAWRALESPAPMGQKKKSRAEINQLITTLWKTEDEDARTEIVNELRETGDSYVIRSLIKRLKDKNPAIRKVSAIALGKLKDERAAKALIARLRDKDDDVYEAAKEALRQIYPNPNILINFLADGDDLIKKYRPLVLVDLRDPRVFKIIMEGISNKNDTVRINAWTVLSLEYSGKADLLESAISALKDENRKVQLLAAKVIGKRGDVRAVKPLIKALETEENMTLQEQLKDSLIKIGGHRLGTVGTFIAALKSISPAVRASAAQSLASLNDPRAIAPLVYTLCDSLRNPTSSFTIGGNSHTLYFNYQEDFHQIFAALKILDPSRKNVLPILLKLLQSENDDTRKGAALALDALRDERSVDALIAALKDNDIEVRKTAAKALGDMKAERAIEPLIELMEIEFALTQDGNRPESAVYAYEALVKITGQDLGQEPAAWRDWWKKGGGR